MVKIQLKKIQKGKQNWHNNKQLFLFYQFWKPFVATLRPNEMRFTPPLIHCSYHHLNTKPQKPMTNKISSQFSYLLKPWTSQSARQNDPKTAKTTWYQPKGTEKIAKEPKRPIISKFEKSGIIYWFLFCKLRAQMPKSGYSRSVSINFLVMKNFCLYPISKIPCILNLTLVFESFGCKCPNLGILGQKVFLTF